MNTSEEMRASWAAFEQRAHQIEWRHDDGSPCPETLNDRLTTATGDSWWCTTHEQRLQGHPKTPTLPEPTE